MEASKRQRPGSPTTMVGGRTAATGGTLSAVGRLIERADALHLRAPELALVLGERAAALAEAAGADEQWIRAESLVVSARVRLGGRPRTVGRAVAALRAAEHAGYGDIAARLRIDLAVCARSVGIPLTGLAALRPLLADPAVSASHRAEALCHLVGCLAQFGRKTELDRVLAEADKLVLGDGSMTADSQLLIRALLRVGVSAHRRRHGDLTSAADAARTGLGMLEKLGNPDDDGGLVRIRLILQLVCTLLDRGDTEMALEVAQPILDAPVRAAGIAPAAWLRLAVATRVLLPAGSGEAAGMLVREAVAGAEDHNLHAVTARLWLELAQIEERLGRAEEAIGCLHRSRAAEHLHARARRQACNVLVGEFGAAENAAVDLDDVLRAVAARPSAAAAPVPTPEPAEVTAVIPAIDVTPPKRAAAEPPIRREPPRPTRQSRHAESAPARYTPVEPPRPAAEPSPVVPPVAPVAEKSEAPVLKPPSRPEPAREAVASDSDWRRRVPKKAKPSIRFEPKAEPVAPKLMPPPKPEPVSRPEPMPRPEPVARPEPEPVRRRRQEEPAARETVAPEPASARPETPAPVTRRRAEEPMPAAASEPVLPELLLAPEPAAEPRPRVAAENRPPGTAAPLWESDEWAAEERARRSSAPVSRKTRHDAEHGSVAAKSVLDRLGISSTGGQGGGRRRADGAADPVRPEPAPEPFAEERAGTGRARREQPPVEYGEPAVPLAPPPREDPAPSQAGGAGEGSQPSAKEEVADPWLPRLRMPPALDPLTDTGSWRPITPFPESYARAIAEDEPPPDAGLADLLARALAEHQAGTASAAALVKQLGSQDSGKRPVNGHDRHRANGSD
ncbi:hypothetical protein SAMN04489729_2931 [Amycolatopsis lurida]|uniref:Uncharacterized protein n=1 Tax=Amycolatopsis lurida NRRL 2430 TaxID=1460371 RepID=A0A2P2FR69_AMYLU|nr:hypothetical protein [Amycolatopsis lurida]KFU79224.1 hypothetical protein BB31_21510 [Amycolatopsis lurida NRRL 2430]SEC96313.1 hypothetical protein SAMN04489729_2931 [Amycolatopsis lurida]